MGRMKDIAIAIEEAQAAGLIPTPPAPPKQLYILSEDNAPIAVYLHKDTAEYDAWLCNAAGDREYKVHEMPFYVETMEEIECRV